MNIIVKSKTKVKIQGEHGDISVDQRGKGQVYRVVFKGTCNVTKYSEYVEVVFSQKEITNK